MSSWGRDNSVGTATRYGLDDQGSNPVGGARFSTLVHTGPVAHPVFTRGQSGRSVNNQPASKAEVKKRVELYLYAPSGTSWPVVGRTLPLPF